jgi:hypothetical protein
MTAHQKSTPKKSVSSLSSQKKVDVTGSNRAKKLKMTCKVNRQLKPHYQLDLELNQLTQ